MKQDKGFFMHHNMRSFLIVCLLPCYALGMQQNTKTYGIVTDKTGKTMILVDPDYYISKKVKPSHYVITSSSSAFGALVGCVVAGLIGNIFLVRPKRQPGEEPYRMPQFNLMFFCSALGGALGSFIGNYWESRPTHENRPQ